MPKIATEVVILKRVFDVCVEQDEEDGLFVASVSELDGCHTQAKSIDVLRERVFEAICTYLGEVPAHVVLKWKWVR